MRLALPALVTVVVGVTVVLGSLYDEGGFDSALLLVGVWAVLGAVIVALRPGNAVGWLFLTFGLWMGIGLAVTGAPEHLGMGAVLTWVSWFGEWFWIAGFGVVIATLFFIPTGRLPSRGWLPVLLVFSAAVAVCSVIASLEDRLEASNRAPIVPNPIGIRGLGDIDSWGGPVLIVLLVGGAVAGAASLVFRYRQGAAEERQQLKLLALAAPFAVVCVVAAGAYGQEPLKSILWDVGMTAIPVSVTVGILRYRLFDVDLLISRTLVYGSLTVLLGLAYAGLVLAGQAIFSSFAGGSNLAIALSTLVARTLEAFAARVRHQVELEGLTEDLQRVVVHTMQPAHVSVWLRSAPQ